MKQIEETVKSNNLTISNTDKGHSVLTMGKSDYINKINDISPKKVAQTFSHAHSQSTKQNYSSPKISLVYFESFVKKSKINNKHVLDIVNL